MKQISSQIAAKRAKVTPATIMNWCRHPLFTVGNLSIGEIALGEWKIDAFKLDLLMKGNRAELIRLLFIEKVSELLLVNNTLLVYFKVMTDVFYLNMFREDIQYYGRRRNLDLSVEVPFLSCMDMPGTVNIPIPLSKIKLIEILEETGFKKTQNIYILRSDGKKRNQE